VNLQRFIVILVMVVVMGLVLVYQHARIIHAGYEMARLSQEREDLNELQRKTAADLESLRRPDVVSARLKSFNMTLVPVEQKDTKVAVTQNDRKTVVNAKAPVKRKR
jgi:hypothetical protein